ncbi:MAG: hypothetical protein ACKOES_12740 [Planctomycetaceae bacterium]
MKPAPVGTRIRVMRNGNTHAYRIGGVYTVFHDDRDGTLKATDETGRVGNWLRWEDCDPAGPSVWERIAADLPEDLVRFLACFDGINALVIKEQVIDTVLAGVPNLHERLVSGANTPAGSVVIGDNLPRAAADGSPTAATHQDPDDADDADDAEEPNA